MKYGPGCVNWIVPLGIFFISLGILCFFRKMDEELQKCSIKEWKAKWLIYGTPVSIVIGIWEGGTENATVSMLLLGVYLVVCTVTDALICQVYDVMQFLGIIGGSLWLLVKEPENRIGFSIVFFALLQYFILIHMYGKADGMGYCICSLYLAGIGMDIEGYLYHMGISFGLLAMLQCFRGNISRKGNLKKPVALYPYMTVSFLGMWIFLL